LPVWIKCGLLGLYPFQLKKSKIIVEKIKAWLTSRQIEFLHLEIQVLNPMIKTQNNE